MFAESPTSTTNNICKPQRRGNLIESEFPNGRKTTIGFNVEE